MNNRSLRFILYALFALIATGINIFTQWPFFIFFDQYWTIYLALAVGTFTGLITKYILDKKWIFYYSSPSRKDDFYRFLLYSLMGVFTTLIFWGTEISFYYFFNFDGSQYVGGAIGLMTGYSAKYLLDKRYVFKVDL